MKSYRTKFGIFLVALVLATAAANVTAETLYVDVVAGNDTNPGTSDRPLRTMTKAAALVNANTDPGPTTIRIAPGVYNIAECILLKNIRPYTKSDRLVIEATILPDDPNWKPSLMPVVISTEDPRRSEGRDRHTETYTLKVQISHATVRGLKFLGNPLLNNWHCCIERVGENLDDLLVTQCVFIGDKDTLDVYCPIIANGHGLVVDHCIFSNCHASAVFWDGPEEMGGEHCAMTYCIVDNCHISGPWTCQTDEDFDFHHNIVTRCEYFWMRKPGDQQKYHIRDCVVVNNKYYSGHGVASGPTGQTGPEVAYDCHNVIREGKVLLNKDKTAKTYLHVIDGSPGCELGAGLFKK